MSPSGGRQARDGSKAMERSAARVTIQSMTVDPDETNAEAFAAVGLFPPVGLEVTLLFTTIDSTIDRKKAT